jgi:hypothetical protein
VKLLETLIVGSLGLSLAVVLLKNPTGTDQIIGSLAGAHKTIFSTLQGR